MRAVEHENLSHVSIYVMAYGNFVICFDMVGELGYIYTV